MHRSYMNKGQLRDYMNIIWIIQDNADKNWVSEKFNIN